MDVNELLSRPAEEFGNDDTLEEMWAAKAFEHAEIYFNLICSVDPKFLHLTPHDQTIYAAFRQEFPSFNVKTVNEDEMKNQNSKVQWRMFCKGFKDFVDDYNYGTLLRVDCSDDYTIENSLLVPRIQFLAIELARNREGYNDLLRKKFKPEKTHDDNK